MADTAYGADRHLEELGLSPSFTLDEARAVLKTLDERLETERERRKVIEAQRREKRKEVAALRGGSVVADHGTGEEPSLEYMHRHQQIDLWRRRV